MSSNFGRSIFVSGLCALPIPLIIPFGVEAIAPESAASAILSSESATSYYLIAWLLITIACLLSTQFSSGEVVQSEDEGEVDIEGDGAESGSVKWFNVNKGFGFITTQGGEDIFVHFRSIKGRGRRSLRQGQSVRFDIVKGDKGLQAENVSVAGK